MLALAGIGAYGAVAYNALNNGRLEFNEVGHIVKASWFSAGTISPFGAGDSMPTMPLYPLELGALQLVIGASAMAARAVSVALGLLSGLVLFALCRKLTANSLASAAAVLIFLGSPATAYSFATATPLAVVSLLHLVALWLLVTSLGRPRMLATFAMGVVLAAIVFHADGMIVPVVLLAVLFIAALGRSRWLHGPLLIVVLVLPIGAAIYLLPDQFTTFALSRPLPAWFMEATGLGRPGASTVMSFDRILRDVVDGIVLPYGGTILLALLLILLTFKGPRVLWVGPIYLSLGLAALAVFPGLSCETCAATQPSQIIAVGALSAAMALAFSGRMIRKNALSGTPFVVGGAILALAINTFAPGLASREALHFFPAEMLKQTRPMPEQRDIAGLMRFVGQNTDGGEPILLLHDQPALPYAVHMAGRKFPPTSLNPLAAMKTVPGSVEGTRREAQLASIERAGGWTPETLKRWIERDYDVILIQDKAITLDADIEGLLASGFETAAATDFRGTRLVLYKRKI
ncbi:MAG: hypothetical protein SFV19_00215 [Rhodospirillaceae bacterium]|nr:hypothetical protein [Rhodospirillaceae bacterium]